MNSFSLKVIAILAMFIDHLGLYFFPEVPILKIVGRLSFPLIAFLLANGARHTTNINYYLMRLFVFASISQPIYLLLNRQGDPQFGQLNILFTLSLGLMAIILLKKTGNSFYIILITILFALFAGFAEVEYGAMGILSILSFYFFSNNFILLFFQQLILYMLYPVFFYPSILLNNQTFLSTLKVNTQIFGSFAMMFIYFYNKKEGLKAKYLFYVFYPLHLALIYIIKHFF